MCFCASRNLPEEVVQEILRFWNCYVRVVRAQSQDEKNYFPLFISFLEQVDYYVKHPAFFAAFHKAIRHPFDYYAFGLEFIRPLVDMQRSTVSGIEVLQTFPEILAKKENIILFANHQTEIDPPIISLLIEKYTPQLAVDMIFVAGHLVTTDPLAVPLSLGRNLLCIYSKRHMETSPEKKVEKMAHNSRVMKVMQDLLSVGGCCIYVAPSGGRDRANDQGIVEVTPFDPQSVELFYLIAQAAKQPVHFHTLTLSTYALLPPPSAIMQQIGEMRTTSFAPAHLFFGPEIAMQTIGNANAIVDKHERRRVRAEAIWKEVVSCYNSFF